MMSYWMNTVKLWKPFTEYWKKCRPLPTFRLPHRSNEILTSKCIQWPQPIAGHHFMVDYGIPLRHHSSELLDTFQPEIKILAANNSISYDDAVQQMTRLYDGYHFCINSVGIFRNPFSVLNVLKSKCSTITGSRPAHRLSSSRCCKKPNTTCVLLWRDRSTVFHVLRISCRFQLIRFR